MEWFQENSVYLYPLLIFSLKLPELCINALRIILTAKGYKFLSALLVFTEACLGVTALGLVFSKLDSFFNVFAFALGMAVGSYLGIILEKKIALGLVLVRVITQLPADELLINLREQGFRVTEVVGESNFGRVGVLFAVVKRNNTTQYINMVTKFNPKAFYTIEEISHTSQDIIRGGRKDKFNGADIIKRNVNSLFKL